MAALEIVAADLRRLWTVAMAGGNHVEVTRLVAGGRAVQDALVVLRANGSPGGEEGQECPVGLAAVAADHASGD